MRGDGKARDWAILQAMDFAVADQSLPRRTRRRRLFDRSYVYTFEPERVQLDVFPSPLSHPYLLLAGFSLVLGGGVLGATQDATRALLEADRISGNAIAAAVVLSLAWLFCAGVVVFVVPRRIVLSLEARGPLSLRVERLLGAPQRVELRRGRGISLLESPAAGTWSLVIGSPADGVWGVLLSGSLPVQRSIADDVARLQAGLADLAQKEAR